jgi:hypothetical protein
MDRRTTPFEYASGSPGSQRTGASIHTNVKCRAATRRRLKVQFGGQVIGAVHHHYVASRLTPLRMMRRRKVRCGGIVRFGRGPDAPRVVHAMKSDAGAVWERPPVLAPWVFPFEASSAPIKRKSSRKPMVQAQWAFARDAETVGKALDPLARYNSGNAGTVDNNIAASAAIRREGSAVAPVDSAGHCRTVAARSLRRRALFSESDMGACPASLLAATMHEL